MQVLNRLLLIIDDSPLSPISQDTLTETGEDEQEYIVSLIDKLMKSDNTAQAKFVPSLGTEGNYGLDDPKAFRDDELLSNMQNYFLECYRTKGIELADCDILFVHATENGNDFLCVLYLPYKIAPAHSFTVDDAGISAEVVGMYHLPPHSAAVPGMLINKNTSLCWIQDLSVKSNGEKKRLFHDLLYSFEDNKTVREVVRAVEETVEEILPNLPPKERTTIVKQALNTSIEDTGAIDMGVISETIFQDQPEQSELFTEKIFDAGVQEVTSVASPAAIPSLEKMRVTTDNGISISIPLTIAQDPDSFEIEQQSDGSFSIVIRHIQTVKTK